MFEIVWIAYMTQAMRNRFVKLLLKRQMKITEILDLWNENFCEPKGLKLSCGYRGAWIELDVNITRNFNDYNFAIENSRSSSSPITEDSQPERLYLDTIIEHDDE